MTDTKTELVKAVADALPVKAVYQDALQPATREVGVAGGEIGAVVRASLRPLRTLRIAWDTVFDHIDGWVAEKLSGAHPEDIVAPPPNLVGGVVTGLVFVQDEPDLRELFVRLLAASMLKAERSHAHPAFAEFIKQMTPLEARMVRFIADEPTMLRLDIRAHDKPEPKDTAPDTHLTPSSAPAAGLVSPLLSAMFGANAKNGLHLGGLPLPKRTEISPNVEPRLPSQMNAEELEQYMKNPPSEPWTDEATFTELDLMPEFANETLLLPSLENLDRLQLIRLSTELTSPTLIDGYIEIARCARAQGYLRKQEARGKVPGLHKGLILPTSLGKEFFRVCVGSVGKAG